MKKLFEKYTNGQIAANKLATAVFRLLRHQSSPYYKLQLMTQLHDLKSQATRSKVPNRLTDYNNLINALKKMFLPKADTISWRDALFSLESPLAIPTKDVSITSIFDFKSECGLGNFELSNAPKMFFSRAIGITHAIATENELNQKETLCLDTDYSYGYSGTTADGIGEYKNPEENKKILKSSKLTAKYVTRLANQFKTPEKLLDALPNIFLKVRSFIKNYFKRDITESACCVFTRAFYYDEENCQVITAAMGDCMAFAWLPESQEIKMLASARQHDLGPQFNPVAITDNLQGTMIQTSCTLLPRNATIFRMTDGAWQMLPNQQSKKCYDEVTKRDYIESSIDEKLLSKLLKQFEIDLPNATEIDYRDFLLEKIILNINTIKKSITPLLNRVLSQHLSQCANDKDLELENVTFDDFSTWLATINKTDHNQFIDALQKSEYVIDLLHDVSISELCQSLLANLEIGDDTTIAVQSLHNIPKPIADNTHHCCVIC